MIGQGVEASVYAARPWVKCYERGVPASVENPDKTLQDFLIEHATQHPKRPVMIFYNRRISYRELDQATSRFASGLVQLGVRPGDRVALHLPNIPQFVIAYYGALRAGAIVVPTNPLYVESEIEHQLNDSGAKVILTLSKLFPTIQSVRAGTGLEHVIVANIKEYFPARLRILFTLAKERKEGHRVSLPNDGRTHWFQDVVVRALARTHAVPASPNDVALFQYTGGTTGTPKAAMLTHRNLLSNVLMAKAWTSGKSDRHAVDYGLVMGVLPLFHVYAMATVMNFAIVSGGAMILVPRFDIVHVLNAIQRHRPNLFPGVPTMYTSLINYPGVEKFNLRSVNACLSGAAALPVEVKRRFEELTGANLVEGYGLTEASPVTHCNPLHGMNKPGSIGLPFPDTDAMIVDAETGTRVLPQGEAGELIVRGPQVMKGYWNRPEETTEVLRGGWLHTGDLGQMDEDGYFYIVDRKKDLIITGGMNVYPRDVEEPLYTHPKVQEAVAVGVADERWGELVKLFVVLKTGEQATSEEIIEFCRTRMASYKVPKVVEFRTELPKSLVGKFLRRKLRDEAEAASQPPSEEKGADAQG